MRFLVFQHLDVEHPGIFRECMRAHGIEYDAVELDAGEPIPELADYHALMVMGGPMDVWEEAAHPWLVAEKRAIRRAVVDLQLPYLGVCLGHQLLACALGGKVGKLPVGEVGLMHVMHTPAAKTDPLFADLALADGTQICLQWHGAGVTALPQLPLDTTVLAYSPLCAVQAMRVGQQAYGIQYHMEITDQTVAQWGIIPEYKSALEACLGAGAAVRLKTQVDAVLPTLHRDARQLFDAFAAIVRAHHA